MNISLFFVGLILCALLQYGIQKIFIYYNQHDAVNFRSSHKTLATRSGGIGIYVTLFIISIFYYFNKIEIFDYSLLIPISIMFIIGVYDDLYNANFKLKFLIQIIVAKILIDQGYVISNLDGIFGIYQIPWVIAQIITIFSFLIIINSFNFIDGIDGLAITEFIKIVLLFELIYPNFNLLTQLSIILISSLIPLYYFNLKKNGKIFLGDGGSLMLGTIIMIYLLNHLNDNNKLLNININNIYVFILFYLFPLFDLIRVFFLRILMKKSPFRPDNNHLHHIILKKIKSHYLTTAFIQIIHLIIIFIFYIVVK